MSFGVRVDFSVLVFRLGGRGIFTCYREVVEGRFALFYVLRSFFVVDEGVVVFEEEVSGSLGFDVFF